MTLKSGDQVLSVSYIIRGEVPFLLIEKWDGHKRSFHLERFPFPPYAFCKADEYDLVDRTLNRTNMRYQLTELPKSEYVSVFGDQLAKLETIYPNDIGRSRNLLYNAHKIRLLEADLRYGKRVEIDLNLRPYLNQKPVYVDIETDPRYHVWGHKTGGSATTIAKMVTRYFKINPIARVLSVAAGDENDKIWICSDDETEIFNQTYDILQKYTLMISWTLYDKEFLAARAKALHIYNRVLRIPALDLMFAFWKAGGKKISQSSHISLATAAKALKVPMKDFGCKADPMKIWEFWEHDRVSLQEYNEEDRDIMIKMNEVGRLTELHEQLTGRFGLMPEDTIQNSDIINILALKLLNKRQPRIVVPCKPYTFMTKEEVDAEKKAKYKGGYVLDPIPGKHYWVAVLDFKTMYPTIMRSLNIGLDTIDPNGAYVALHNRYKESPKSVMVEIIDLFEDWKNELTELYDNAPAGLEKFVTYNRRRAVKTLLASVSGVMGALIFRLYHKPCIEDTTLIGQDIIKHLVTTVPKTGIAEIVYGDTDSVFVKLSPTISTNEEAYEVASRLEKILQREVQSFCRQKFNAPVKMEIEVDKLYRLLYFGKKTSGKGIKKKYVGRLIWEKGFCDQLDYMGYELKRRDWTAVAKRVQKACFNFIIQDPPEIQLRKLVSDLLAEVRDELFSGRIDKDLVFSKNLGRELETYKVNQPHIRAARKLKQRGKYTTRQVINYVVVSWIKKKMVVEPIIGDDLPRITWSGYRYYWEKQVIPIVQRLGLLDVGYKTLDKFFTFDLAEYRKWVREEAEFG